jgi:Kef-type K+ transport system membrane component KefB
MSNILIIIALMIIVPWVLWKILRLETWVPLPMFQVVLGIVLGPSITGHYFPELWNSFFTDQIRTGLNAIQMIAISIFAFIAGSELKIGEVIEEEGNSIWLQGLKVIAVPILIASVCFWLLFDSTVWHGKDIPLWQFAWSMGVATCITAMPMLVIALKQLGLWETALGRKLLLLVTFDDLVLWMTVLFVISLGTYLTKSILFFGVFAILWYVWPKFLEKTNSTSWPILTVSLAFGLGYFSDWAGLHYVLGAFLAGMISPRFSLAWNKEMETIQMYWLMPVFFIWTGLRTNWSTDWSLIIGAALIMYIISLITKFIGVWLAYRNLGITEVLFKTSLLQNKGLMEILLGTVMLGANIISSNMFAAIVLMSVLSTITAVPLAKLFYKRELKIHE